MTLHALEIPDDPAELPGWLEGHLVGPDLAALVAELEAVRPADSGAAASVQAVLGDRLEAVLDRGLSAAPPGALQRLLRRPRLLLALQELVMEAGGDYWDRVRPSASDLDAVVARGRTRLEAFLAAEGAPSAAARPIARAIGWYRRPWLVSLATAAAVLLAVLAFDRFRSASTPPGWGWDRPGALTEGLPAAAYLDRLAVAAEEWFDQRPAEPAALARRIAEFRRGCSVLILSEHRPLAVEDRRWLVERCRVWAAELDRHLAGVEAGRDPMQVRAEADATIRQLVAALRGRAKALATG